MTDLIERQTAYEVLTDYYHHETDVQHKALKEALNRVPADDGDAVRVAVYDATKKVFADRDLAWNVYQKIMQEIEK